MLPISIPLYLMWGFLTTRYIDTHGGSGSQWDG